MLAAAAERGFAPRCVLFDQWYGSLENLKAIRATGWSWLTQLKANRLVNSDGLGSVPVSLAGVTAAGRVVHLQGYGRIKVFAIAARDGGIEYWATNDLEMSELTRLELAERIWAVEEYHRGLKQYCGVERCSRGATRRSATTWGWRSGRCCVWNGIATPRGSVGRRPRPGSSARPCGSTSTGLCTSCHILRNYYPN